MARRLSDLESEVQECRALNLRVAELTDLVAGVHPDSSEKALAEIAHAGAVLVESGGAPDGAASA